MSRRPVRLIACLLLLTPALVTAQALWKWRDANGTMQISDQPPPMSVPDKAIISRPGAAPAPAAVAPEAPTEAASAPPRRDTALEDKKRALQAAQRASDAQAQAGVAQRNQAQRDEACQRARASQATLDSGMRVARVNARGEREFLDDQARTAELERVRQQVAAACR